MEGAITIKGKLYVPIELARSAVQRVQRGDKRREAARPISDVIWEVSERTMTGYLLSQGWTREDYTWEHPDFENITFDQTQDAYHAGLLAELLSFLPEEVIDAALEATDEESER